MADLLEVVLENISRSKVCQLLMLLLGYAGRIVEVQCSEGIELSSENDISEDDVRSFISLSEDASLIVKLNNLNIAGNIIPSVLLRLIKYGDQFDIDFNFDEADIAGMGTTALMKQLHVCVSELGKEYQVSDWFGGLEPASDEDTRYFTGSELGPLS